MVMTNAQRQAQFRARRKAEREAFKVPAHRSPLTAIEQWVTALHEAGHAVVAELLAPGSVKYATRVPTKKWLGQVRHGSLNGEPRCIMAFSGMAAEVVILRAIFGELPAWAALMRRNKDGDTAIIKVVSAGDARFETAMRGEADRIVSANFALIQEVAHALTRRLTLPGPELRAIIARHLKAATDAA